MRQKQRGKWGPPSPARAPHSGGDFPQAAPHACRALEDGVPSHGSSYRPIKPRAPAARSPRLPAPSLPSPPVPPGGPQLLLPTPSLQQFVRAEAPGGSCRGTDALGTEPRKAFAVPRGRQTVCRAAATAKSASHLPRERRCRSTDTPGPGAGGSLLACWGWGRKEKVTNAAWMALDCGQGCALVVQSCRSMVYVVSLFFF